MHSARRCSRISFRRKRTLRIQRSSAVVLRIHTVALTPSTKRYFLRNFQRSLFVSYMKEFSQKFWQSRCLVIFFREKLLSCKMIAKRNTRLRTLKASLERLLQYFQYTRNRKQIGKICSVASMLFESLLHEKNTSSASTLPQSEDIFGIQKR